MLRRLLSVLLIVVASLLVTGAHGAVDNVHPAAQGELIVKFRPGGSAAAKAALARGHRLATFRSSGAEHWKLDDADAVAATVALLEADPQVEYVEPNYLITVAVAPNDPYFSQLWALENTGQVVGTVPGAPDADIDAVEAWDIFAGSASVTVAVIDTGIDYNHPDLAANIWTNPGEIAGNGLDDDGNGFIDDIHGWDFANGDSDPMDDNNHGTHCAGIIGAVADNGIGVAGVNRTIRIVALKFLNASSIGTTANAIACIEYATLMGVDVMSNSWGSGAHSAALAAAIQAAHAADIFFVAAAGNTGSDNDAVPFFPANYDMVNVISVMATDNRDQRAVASNWSSNYGAETVDIAAPGVRIWSTIRNDSYMYLSGTSMAAPYVAGALALLRGRFPDISVADGRFLLMNVGRDRVPALTGVCASGSRLNLRRLIADPDVTPPAPVTDLMVGDIASNWLVLDWTVPTDDGILVGYDLRWSTAPIVDQAGWDAATPVDGLPAPGAAGAPGTFRVEGLPSATACYFCLRAKDEYGNVAGLSNCPLGVTQGSPAITVSPPAFSADLSLGGTGTRTLTITNSGAGILDFTIPRHSPVRPAAAAAGAFAGSFAGAGLPSRADGYGYDWTDSDSPGGPAFNWIDLENSGTAVSFVDDSSRGPFDVGFAFPMYGHNFTSFLISGNGCVHFAGSFVEDANTGLPSAGAPGNLLAILWDQMTPGVGTCRFISDGSRLVVQYTGVDNAGDGGPYTMQMHVYANGIIEYHYLSLVEPASESATIGIQNGDGSEGLTVARDTAYVHDNLAVRFTPPPTWLSVSPDNGNLAPGMSVDLAVTFDSAGQCGSHFDGNLHVLSNDPSNPCVVVQGALGVAAPSDLAVNPASLAFGSVRFGATSTRNVIVTNNGCGDLMVQDLVFDNAAFSSTQALPLLLRHGAWASVPVTFAPLSPSAFSGTLTLVSNDPDSPALALPVGGTGLEAPDIAISPASLADTMSTSATLTHPLTITNNGLVDLSFTIMPAEYVDAVNKGAGGPDAYGYRWTDSDDPAGPTYNWIEISMIGTPIALTTTQNWGPFPIGFDFPFYGSTFTSYRVNAQGYISFTSASSSDNNLALPDVGAPENLIAPYWDDITLFGGAGGAYRHFDGQRLIVEYQAALRVGTGGTCTFQIHLYPSGRIEFHYRTIPATLDGATIGIQNALRTDGLTVAHNTRYVRNNLAVRIEAQPFWLSATPTSGILAAGASIQVMAGINALGLCSGTNLANLRVQSNDPDSPEVVVPVSLTTIDAPDLRYWPASLAFGDVYTSQAPVLTSSLANIGCAPVHVTGLSIDNPAFEADAAVPFAIAAGANKAINVMLTPAAAGATMGTMTLTTTDTRRPLVSIPISATVFDVPGISVTPGAITLTVPPNQQRTATIHLENSGTGALNFSITSPTLNDKEADNGAGNGKEHGQDLGAVNSLDAGGPDAFGYRWLDSAAAGGPAFSWIEIAGTGTVAMAAGDNVISSRIGTGFTVPFYGGNCNFFCVGSEGFIQLIVGGLGGGYGQPINRSLPSLAAPGSIVAPFWDDLDLNAAGSGDIWYKRVDGNLVVQWDHIMRAGTSTPVTFEVIVKPSGSIVFQYLAVGSAVTNSATVGIQNSAGTVGLPVAYNTDYIHDNLAVQFWIMPRWANVSPATGTVPPGSSADLSVTLNAAGMPVAPHHAQMSIVSNDPTQPTIVIPLTMNVLGYVSGASEELPRALSLSQNAPNPFNPSTLIRLALPAKGPVDLRIYDVRGRLVRMLADGECAAGNHDFVWDGRSDSGAQVPSGVYFCRLRTDDGDLTRSMTLVK